MNPVVKFFLHWYWLSFLFHFVLIFTVGYTAFFVRIFRKSID